MFGLENSANNFGASAGLLANTLANRPTQAALGTLFIGTNNLILYRYNGSTWDIISGGGIAGATNGLQVIGTDIGLGGGLTQNTDINCFNYNFKFEVFNSFAIGDGTEPTLILNSSAQTFITSFNGNEVGLQFDFSVNRYFFGDFDFVFNGTSLTIDDSNQVIKTYGQSTEIGLKLDFNNGVYLFGDMNFIVNGTSFVIDDGNQIIKTVGANNDVGLKLDFPNAQYLLGDFNNNNNGTHLFITDLAEIILSVNRNNYRGLKLDFGNLQYWLGDYSSTTNGYWLLMDDGNGQLVFNGANLISGTASGNSGQHLVIVLNGNPYKIKLENP